ncbi:type II toxin-antitoxin system RelE/ParE family toxin [Novosphingopyxis sp.]|uniref:type II toxin-antitoxin system RelE/ParE family toxin n=1 Tax=Novosphingopyxis sp. TaxID=2709690 RepID=UPI003B58EE6A
MAKQELAELRRFSKERWGQAVAVRYLEDIRDSAKRLAANPLLAKLLRDELRILRVRSHYLIVHVDETVDRLTVARVLHTAMDIERHLGGV